MLFVTSASLNRSATLFYLVAVPSTNILKDLPTFFTMLLSVYFIDTPFDGMKQ
jgi:hypothetical protein